MNNKVLVLIYTCLCLCIGSATHLKAQTFNYSQLQEHPRLLLKQGEEQRIHKSLSESVELQERGTPPFSCIPRSAKTYFLPFVRLPNDE